ncbi:MAG: hypothetical protein NTX11_01010 [Candidatus Saccharibacteria bacterium]|nr:hypothetical protein [Candidatus Saccharibacteria bacterium]
MTKSVVAIDFSPLDSLNNKSGLDINFAILFILGIFGIIFGGAILSSVAIQLIGYFGILVGIGIFIYKSSQQSKAYNAALAQFATVNSWQFQTFGRDIDKIGTIFSLGHGRQMNSIYSGVNHDLPFQFYTYNYTIGYGKGQQIFDLQVFELTLPRALPHMIIDSLVEDGNHQASTLPIDYDESQKIELEGDFSKYFALYAPDNYGITALTVLAPDVMETLMQFAASCDIEIIQNKMYFYWPLVPGNKKAFQDMFASVDQVLNQTLRKLTSSDIYATPNQATIQSTASNQSNMLVKSWWNSTTKTAAFVIFLTLAYGSGALLGGDAGVVVNFITFVALIIGGIAYTLSYVVRGASRARKRNNLKDRRYS